MLWCTIFFFFYLWESKVFRYITPCMKLTWGTCLFLHDVAMSYCDNDMLLPHIFEYIPMLWFLPHLKIQLWGTPCPAKILAILGLQEVLGGWKKHVPQSYWSEDPWDWDNEHLPPEVSASLSWRNKGEVSTSSLPSPCGLGTNLSAATCDPAESCYWAASLLAFFSILYASSFSFWL